MSSVATANGDTTIVGVYISTLSPGSEKSLRFSYHCGLASRLREGEKFNHRVIQKITTNEAGKNTILTSIILSASGAMGPLTVAFLKDVYAKAKDHTINLHIMARQPHPDPNHAPQLAPRPPAAASPNQVA